MRVLSVFFILLSMDQGELGSDSSFFWTVFFFLLLRKHMCFPSQVIEARESRACASRAELQERLETLQVEHAAVSAECGQMQVCMESKSKW